MNDIIEIIMDKIKERRREREIECNRIRLPLSYDYNRGYTDAEVDIECILYNVLNSSTEENNDVNVVTW